MNTLGNIFKVHSFGESHGPAVGCVIDGCPAGLELDLEKVQQAVDQRKTGQHNFSSQRKESDKIQLISGVFEGKTLGSPICILIHNEDAQSKDYNDLKDVYRPGHADYTNEKKYGFRDYRGGGRTSIRITAPMVAAGEIARQLLGTISKSNTTSFVSQIGTEKYEVLELNEKGLSVKEQEYLKASDKNICNADFDKRATDLMESTAENGDTLGGRISTIVENVEAGLGESIFGKVQAQLSQALFSINTVKGVEFGKGMTAAEMLGSAHNDSFIPNKKATDTNNHGGLLGGITSGNCVVFHVYFKPISSIRQTQRTIDKTGETVEIEIKGRHDVCAVPRAVPIVEAYTNIILANLILQNGNAKI